MIIHTSTLDTKEKVIAIYGGTNWAMIDGRFLLGYTKDVYPINSLGGASIHTLQLSEMPNHDHRINIQHSDGDYGSTLESLTCGIQVGGRVRGVTRDSGSGQPHNNMPPYRVVYIWERTA